MSHLSERRVAVRLLLGVLAACLAVTFQTAPARAAFGIASPTSGVALSTTQAGAHGDLTVNIDFNRIENSDQPDSAVRDVKVSLPAGFWGSPDKFQTCTSAELWYAGLSGICPPATRVGAFSIVFYNNSTHSLFGGTVPLYNLEHGDDAVAAFGANPGLLAVMKVKVRPSDFGLDTLSLSLPIATLSIAKVGVTLWGVPADHNGSGLPRQPFMTNPVECNGRLSATISADSWETPGAFDTEPFAVPQLTGCDHLPAPAPELVAGPSGSAADEPSGYDVDLRVPQVTGPDAITVPTLKDVAVAFPAGVAISPAAADGLQACTDAQLGVGEDSAPACPDASKVGTVSIDTPALSKPLEGAMYLGVPRPGAPYRLFLVASGSSVMIKLRGEAVADPVTGQVTTTFHDTPALPFSRLQVHLKSGSRALLANPIGCGTYTASATVTPNGGGAPVTATSPFTIDGDGRGGACSTPTPFHPQLSAGTTNPVAGASSPFRFRLTRADGDRELGAISSVHLPAGLIADVSNVPLCSDAAAATASCPASTRVGAVHVGSGAGSNPLYLPGDVYLTGPYKGAPFGLSIVVRAVAGPYDLGTVNVRAAVKVNPDASLTVAADPLPTILQGIPLRLRDIVMDFDRPGFMLNPTSCAPATITASAVSVDGLAASTSNRFQVGDCAALGYAPKLSLKLGASDRKARTVALTAHIDTREGDANSKQIAVKLPAHIGLNVSSGVGLCSVAQLAARSCPADSVVGKASVDSILHEPLNGPVYFVTGAKPGELPRLWVPLTGEGVTIDLMAQSSLAGGRIVTTFAPIPDVKFSTFDLTINGGAKGILRTDGKECTTTLTSPVRMDGYNGKLHDRVLAVPAGCPLRVLSRSLSKSRLSLKVSGVGAGTLRVSGAGIRSSKKRLAFATVATIRAGRTRKAAPTRVKVTFDPAGSAKPKTIRVALP